MQDHDRKLFGRFQSKRLGFLLVAVWVAMFSSPTVAAYQSRKPVTYKLIRKQPSGAATIINTVDLEPGETEVVETEAYFSARDLFYQTGSRRYGSRR